MRNIAKHKQRILSFVMAVILTVSISIPASAAYNVDAPDEIPAVSEAVVPQEETEAIQPNEESSGDSITADESSYDENAEEDSSSIVE